LPLSALVSLALESTWPKQLRFEFAMAVWTRGVLLDRPEEAHRLTPILIEGEPGWKSWLTAFDAASTPPSTAASTPDDRQVRALLALMRFPSVRPYINSGAGREEGFVGYSSYRDNWWCAGIGIDQNAPDTFTYSGSYNIGFGGNTSASPKRPQQQLPSFITPAMATEAHQEHAQLETIGDAPGYFGRSALAWVKAHPTDKRNPELLGFAFRAMRNGCNLEAYTQQRHQVFDTLHTLYPQSEWAKRYTKFESDPQ
jgi:hypothetical protein